MNKIFDDDKVLCNDKGRSFFKGLFALKIYAGLMGIKSMQEAWSKKDPLKAYPEAQKVMTFKLYNRVRKHFGVTSTEKLTLAIIRCKMSTGCWHTYVQRQSLWTPEEVSCIHKDRVKSRSRKNAFNTREQDKPRDKAGQS